MKAPSQRTNEVLQTAAEDRKLRESIDEFNAVTLALESGSPPEYDEDTLASEALEYRSRFTLNAETSETKHIDQQFGREITRLDPAAVEEETHMEQVFDFLMTELDGQGDQTLDPALEAYLSERRARK